MSKTAVIQIGNSDDKLSQREWFAFCSQVRDLTENLGDVHFSGYSSPLAPWQNACFVVELESMDDLRGKLRKLAGEYGQDSIALTIGETEFVEP